MSSEPAVSSMWIAPRAGLGCSSRDGVLLDLQRDGVDRGRRTHRSSAFASEVWYRSPPKRAWWCGQRASRERRRERSPSPLAPYEGHPPPRIHYATTRRLEAGPPRGTLRWRERGHARLTTSTRVLRASLQSVGAQRGRRTPLSVQWPSCRREGPHGIPTGGSRSLHVSAIRRSLRGNRLNLSRTTSVGRLSEGIRGASLFAYPPSLSSSALDGFGRNPTIRKAGSGRGLSGNLSL